MYRKLLSSELFMYCQSQGLRSR